MYSCYCHMPKPKILFVLKRRISYGISFGLVNSCHFVRNALKEIGIESRVITVVDSNSINKEIHNYKPTHVICEAIWTPPYKIQELLNIHKDVKFDVRIHSKTPFLIEEGIAFQWLKEYNELQKQYDNFNISANNTDLITEVKDSLDIELKYTPNFYKPNNEISNKCFPWEHHNHIINIASLGALRPLKNTGLQALAALAFANSINKTLHFHVNFSRPERGGEPILKNLRNIFKDSKHKLIEHDWKNHPEFIQLVKKIDIGMQVSMSESFNLVSGDFVWNNIPIVGSEEIEFLTPECQAKTTDINDIVHKLKHIYRNMQLGSNILQKKNKKLLDKSNKRALKDWQNFLISKV